MIRYYEGTMIPVYEGVSLQELLPYRSFYESQDVAFRNYQYMQTELRKLPSMHPLERQIVQSVHDFWQQHFYNLNKHL